MIKNNSKYIVNTIVLFVIVLAYFGMRCLPKQSAALPQKNSVIYVTRAIDGDTVKLSTGEHVRLIGIDTPESRYNAKLERDVSRSSKDMRTILNMGKEASNFTKRLVEGKRVTLEFDVQKHDKYGRLLAYIYLEDGTFVNAKIIEDGYAQIMTIPPNVKYSGLFMKLQREAKDNNRGLWRDSTDKELF